MSISVITGKPLAEAIQAGSSELGRLVGVTLGPSAKTVAIERPGRAPIVVQDGHTVAVATQFSGPAEPFSRALKHAAAQVAEEAGDGTTTTIVLGVDMLSRTSQVLAAGMNPVEISNGMRAATTEILESLERLSRPCVSQSELATPGFLW